MNSRLLLFSYLVVALAAPILVTAQKELENVDAIVSGVRANKVEGEISYKRGDESFKLQTGVVLKEGDQITSGSTARAEVLLQPGNYLRFDAEIRVRLLGDQYDRLKLQLATGSVSLELLKNDWNRWSPYSRSDDRGYELIRILTKDGEVLIAEPGIYRIDVLRD